MTDPYIVYGIAAVSTVNGEPYVDYQGDHIPTAELQRVAHEFMSEGDQSAGVMHLRNDDGSVVKAGRVVSSVVLTDALQRSLGVSIGMEPWIIGVQVDNPAVAKAIKSGALAGFSIAGSGIRTPAETEE